MKLKQMSVAVASLVMAGAAFAQSTTNSTNTANPANNYNNSSSSGSMNSSAPASRTTTTTTESYSADSPPIGTGTSYGVNDYQRPHTLRDESIGIIPQFGVVTFTDATGSTDSRGLVGLGLDFNFLSPSETPRNGFFGLSTGGFYSHLGSAASSFWGAGVNGPGATPGANMVLIPANLKIGYNLTDAFRVSVRGGGNVIYRSAASAMNLGSGSDVQDSSWKIYPDVGADLEWQVGDNVAIIARPDVTFAPNNNMFTGTLGATIMPSF